MRHRVKGRKLSRTASHRKATMQALSAALIKERRIITTVAKAKELRGYIEPLITRAKEDNGHNRRIVFSSLQNKDAVTELFQEVGPKSKDRPGGYTRVIKAGFRKGDGAELAVIELVDYNDIKPEGTESSSSKKRTRRAGKSNKPSSTSKNEEKKADVVKEDSVDEQTDTDEVSEVKDKEETSDLEDSEETKDN